MSVATAAPARRGSRTATACRSCGGERLRVFLSLGEMPLPDALVDPARPPETEARYPLDVAFCSDCSLVQITEEVDP